MKTLAVINIKGGVGKTISAVNMAAVLSEQGHRVLVVDLDPQANATQLLNCYSVATATISEVILEKGFDVRNAIIKTQHENLWLIRSHINFAFAESKIIVDTTRQQQTRLSKSLKAVQDDFDYCILDCPPNIGVTTINALVAADYAMVPIKIDQFAIDGLDYLLATVFEIREEFNENLKFIGCFITMDNDTTINNGIKAQLQGIEQLKLFNTTIRHNVTVPQSTFAQLPVVFSSKSSKSAQGYYQLTEEFLERISQ